MPSHGKNIHARGGTRIFTHTHTHACTHTHAHTIPHLLAALEQICKQITAPHIMYTLIFYIYICINFGIYRHHECCHFLFPFLQAFMVCCTQFKCNLAHCSQFSFSIHTQPSKTLWESLGWEGIFNKKKSNSFLRLIIHLLENVGRINEWGEG